MNLAAVGCISSLKKASELIKQLRLIYGFFSQSVVHAKLGETKELHGLSTSELKRHSDTRWCCQHASCKNARILPPATIDTLNHFAESDDPKDRERRGDSLGILGIIDTLWVFNLCMMEEVLRKCKSLHLLLQSPELDLNAAIVLIKATQGDVSEELDAIERGADTSSCDNVWQSFEALRDDLDLSAPRRRPVGRARRDAAADEAVVYDTPDDYRLKVYAPTLHAVVEELDRRFGKETFVTFRGIEAPSPKSPSFLNFDKTIPLAQQFDFNLEDLRDDFETCKRILVRGHRGTAMTLKLLRVSQSS